MTPGRKLPAPGVIRNGTYVVCQECGKEFAYDWESMQIGQPRSVPVAATEAQPVYH